MSFSINITDQAFIRPCMKIKQLLNMLEPGKVFFSEPKADPVLNFLKFVSLVSL